MVCFSGGYRTPKKHRRKRKRRQKERPYTSWPKSKEERGVDGEEEPKATLGCRRENECSTFFTEENSSAGKAAEKVQG